MGISGIFRFAMDNIAKNISKFLISVSLISICTLICIIVFFSYLGSGYSYTSLDGVLNSGVEGTGVLLILRADDSDKSSADFLDEVRLMENVKAIGSTSLGSTYGLENLAKIQKNNSDKYDTSSVGMPEVLYLNYNAIDLCDLNIENGIAFKDLQSNDNKRYLYLGNGFKNEIQIGESYETNGLIYEVAGILDRDSKWVDWSIVNGFTSQRIDYTYPLEYAVIMVEFGSPSMSAVLFSVYDDSKIEKTMDQISQLAKESEISISVQSLDELYQEDSSDLIIMRNYIFRLFAIVVFATIVIVSCLQLDTIMSEKRRYGIYYSIGMMKSDLIKIIITETFIKGMVSVLVSGTVGLLLAKWWFSFSEINPLLNEIYFGQTIPKVSVIAIIVIFLSTIVPFWVINNYTPRELIGGKDDLFR